MKVACKRFVFLLAFILPAITPGFSAFSQTLIHRYSFISNANDEVGTANGAVEGGAVFSGGALVLNGTNGYVALPAGIVNGLTAVTIETWATFGTIANNSFLFGFGNTDNGGSGEDYLFCTPHGGGSFLARAAISGADPGYTAEQEAGIAGALDNETNVMVATVFNPPANFIGLYINGILVASNNAVTDPLSVVNDQYSYIGHSLYHADPYLKAAISEFRIFNGALTNGQIAIDTGAGPGQIVTNPGSLVSIGVLGPASAIVGTPVQLNAVGNFLNVTNVPLFGYGQPTVTSGNTGVLTVNSSGIINPVAPGQAYVTVQYGGHITRQLVTVSFPTNAFVFNTFGDGFWAITNAGNGQALTANANGASQEAYTNGGLDQQFALLYNYQNSTFRLLQHSGWQCLGTANGGTTIGSGITDVNYGGQSSQQWYIVSVGNGLYRIINAASDYAMQTDGGNPANVTLAASGTNRSQLWGFSYQTHWPKKGTAGYEGPPYQGEFQTAWAYNYNDNTGASEPSNFDFVPMVDTEYWEPISDLQYRDSGWLAQPLPAALLGYNEPDNPSYSTTAPTVSQAIANWPALMALDIPLVAPAMQDEEDSWETSFYSQISADGYRVDYAACHLYVPPNTASFISDIQSEYNAHGLPVWVTEFSPVDWNNCQCWSEDDDYNFLAEFMWMAEGESWLERYSVFPFSNTNPDSPWVDNGFTGSVFMSDGQTLSPYGELYATWDGTTYLQTRTPYLIHNLGTSFRLTSTNSSSVPVPEDIYVRDASAQWALLPAPTANQYYIISLKDGRRLCNSGGVPVLAPFGTTNSGCQWWMNGPNSEGYYYIDNLSVSQSIEATGSAPAISFGMINDPAPSSATEWRLIKPYQPVAIVTPLPPSVTMSYSSQTAALAWSGNGSFYNVYRSTTSGGSYTRIASGIAGTNYADAALQNGTPYYYVVTSLDILGEESAYSAPVAAYPASTASVTMGVHTIYNGAQNGFQASWPNDHIGWRLLMNTNGLANPNWVAVPNSATTNQVWIPLGLGPEVFFELVYP
jgi:Glycosyl hydrolase catalytic core/Concanavalin A-like lectin/glucanases superfamily/Ricin-type beta-trefoil lectin domain-like